MRTNVLKTLDVLGVSKEEALEYIQILEQREQEKQQRTYIETPLEVAYLLADNSLEFLPHLDLNRKAEIFGIKIGKCIWKLTTSAENTTFYDASALAKKEDCLLPLTDDFADLLYGSNNKVAIINIVNIFKQNNIDINIPDGPVSFWTREKCNDGETIKAVNMYERDVYKYDPTKRTAHAHFVRYA